MPGPFACTPGLARWSARVTSLARVLPFLYWLPFVPACAATACFWPAVLAGKGGRLHCSAGRLFAQCVYATAWAGLAAALAGMVATAETRQTMWPVFYVVLVLVAPVQHGLAVVRAGASPAAVRSRRHAWLNLLAMAGGVLLLAVAVYAQRWIVLVLTPLGFAIGLRNMSYAGRAAATPGECEAEHLTSMITAGSVLHTMLLVWISHGAVFVPRHVGEPLLWIAPAVVGFSAIAWLRARRRRD